MLPYAKEKMPLKFQQDKEASNKTYKDANNVLVPDKKIAVMEWLAQSPIENL